MLGPPDSTLCDTKYQSKCLTFSLNNNNSSKVKSSGRNLTEVMTQSSLDHKGKPDPLRSEGPCFHTANFLFSEIKSHFPRKSSKWENSWRRVKQSWNLFNTKFSIWTSIICFLISSLDINHFTSRPPAISKRLKPVTNIWASPSWTSFLFRHFQL